MCVYEKNSNKVLEGNINHDHKESTKTYDTNYIYNLFLFSDHFYLTWKINIFAIFFSFISAVNKILVCFKNFLLKYLKIFFI